MSMVIVEHNDSIDPDRGYVLPHICQSREMAEAVMIDMTNRHSVRTKINEDAAPVEVLVWDGGGSLMVDTPPDSRTLIHFWAHQYDVLINEIDRGLGDIRNVNGLTFCKIRSAFNVLCVDLATANTVKDFLVANKPELDKTMNDVFDDWEAKMDQMRRNPHKGIFIPSAFDPSKSN